MKKIKTLIISIYIITFLLVTIGTSIFVAQEFKKSSQAYFQEVRKTEVKVINQSEIEKSIDLLKKFKIVQ